MRYIRSAHIGVLSVSWYMLLLLPSGAFAQAIVAEKVNCNHFRIKTNGSNIEVSRQVTGIRQDAYANKHRIPVEETKPEIERGSYLHPDVFNQREDRDCRMGAQSRTDAADESDAREGRSAYARASRSTYAMTGFRLIQCYVGLPIMCLCLPAEAPSPPAERHSVV